MRKNWLRLMPMIASGILLITAIGFGIFVSYRIQQYIESERTFYTESLLDQSASLNRVIFAMEEYSAYPQAADREPGWIAKKIELCRLLVSQASIPPFIDPAAYSALVTEDPLLLADRLAKSNSLFRDALEPLAECYTRLAAAADTAGQLALLAEFDGLYRQFRTAMKERSTVMSMIESTYHSQFRLGVAETFDLRNQVFIGQSVAVLSSLVLMVLTFRSQLRRMKTLSGLIPICANCKKVRNDEGYWSQVETYIALHSEADFTHSICPDCMKELYPEYNDLKTDKMQK